MNALFEYIKEHLPVSDLKTHMQRNPPVDDSLTIKTFFHVYIHQYKLLLVYWNESKFDEVILDLANPENTPESVVELIRKLI